MIVVETERLILREIDSATDAEFIFALLNSPKFLRFIGDRGVKSVAEATEFIAEKYRPSYAENGYGLYAVVLKQGHSPIGICGLVRRPNLPGPDIGFAFLPEYERQGYGTEAAKAILEYGVEKLHLKKVYAITTEDNEASGHLLERLGFSLSGLIDSPENEKLRLYQKDLPEDVGPVPSI